MLEISELQMQAIEADFLDQFEERALAFLYDEFPERFAMAGTERMRQAVRNGTERAMLVGFDTDRTVIDFLTLQHLFADDVDTSSRWPILRDALNDQQMEQHERMDRALHIADWMLDQQHAETSV